MSLRTASRLWITAAGWVALVLLLAAGVPASAQYPGQITNADKNAPTLRAVAVFEWTGDEAKPKTSRLVPICIYDGQDLQDADIYLARPFPLALSSDVEYQLLRDGKPSGLFDIETAAREQGSWVGYGKHLPMPAPKPKPAQVAKIDEYDDSQSDTPILHRKHHAGDPSSGSGGDSSGGSSTSSAPDPNAPAPDPDRPTLHKGGDASASNSGTARIRIPAATPPAPIPRKRPIPALPRCIVAATPPAPTVATLRIPAAPPAPRNLRIPAPAPTQARVPISPTPSLAR